MISQLMPAPPSSAYKPLAPTWREEMRVQVPREDSIYVHNVPNESLAGLKARRERREEVMEALHAKSHKFSDTAVAQLMIDHFRLDYVDRVRNVYPEGFVLNDLRYQDVRQRRETGGLSHQFDFTDSVHADASVFELPIDNQAWTAAFPQFASHPLDIVLLWMCLPERKKLCQYLPSGALLMALKERIEAIGQIQMQLVGSLVSYPDLAHKLFDLEDPTKPLVRPLCVSPLAWWFHQAHGHPFENVIHDFFHVEQLAGIADKTEDFVTWRRQQRKLYDAFDFALNENGVRDVRSTRVPVVTLRELLLEGETLKAIKGIEFNLDPLARLTIPPAVLKLAYAQLMADPEMQVFLHNMQMAWANYRLG